MAIKTDPALIYEISHRSVAEIYPTREALEAALASGRQLTFYCGIDPTATYVHLGHSTNYIILDRLHKMGHKIKVLVGDFTAMIGDPSDKTSARVQLTADEVQENLRTFKRQIGKILDFDNPDNPIEFVFNGDWLKNLTFKDAVELASNFTVQQMLERDAFQKRLKEQKPLYVHEFFYPLMQGYDSVAMDVDAEIGGTDQTFNMLAGRTLLKRYKDKEKFVIATTLLENPETGEKLMSKSLGTGIGMDEPPRDMFFKAMQLADAGVIQCFIDCTRLTLDEIDNIKAELTGGANPRDIKLRLAHEIVRMYHDQAAADTAQAAWLSEVSGKNKPTDIAEHPIDQPEINIPHELITLGIADSLSNARRLIQQGGVRINDTKIDQETVTVNDGDLLQVGKKHIYRLRLEVRD